MRHVRLRQGIGEAKVAADKPVGTVKQQNNMLMTLVRMKSP
jgi:hypothetical protein